MLDIVGLFMHDFLLCETWCVACGSKPFDRASQHFACGPWEVSAVKHLLGFRSVLIVVCSVFGPQAL